MEAVREPREEAAVGEEEDRWGGLLPELVEEVVRRVEASGDGGRAVARAEGPGVVRPSPPGPKDFPIQCFVKRNKKKSMLYLYLGLLNGTMDKGKFLMAARRFRRGPHTEYVISLDADDLSQGSNAYVGKLRYMTASYHMMVQKHQALDLASGLEVTAVLEVDRSAPKYQQATSMLGISHTNTTFLNPGDLGECFPQWSARQLKKPGRIPS